MIENRNCRQSLSTQWEDIYRQESFHKCFKVTLHGVPFEFHLPQGRLFDQLTTFFPIAWQKNSLEPIKVFWMAPQEIVEQRDWDNISNPDCIFFDSFISQRDFLAKKINDKSYQLMAKPELSDGVFNFLRFLLPIELLKKDKILFHSSCVVNQNKEPYLFFGPSGAGKTTIASLFAKAGQFKILGDDMNVLTYKYGEFFVEGAAIGQRIFDPKNFAKQYYLDRVFWLVQDKMNESFLQEQGQMKYFLSSFANLFWDQLSPEAYSRVFQLVEKLKQKVDLYHLSFTKNSGVVDYVRTL